MAKNGKLSKLRSIIKRWNSSTRTTLTGGGGGRDGSSESTDDDDIPSGFHPVFVGKSRRRYLLSSDVIDRPIFQTLINRSSGGDGGAFVGCEVVLFEHLLWMLENADPQPELLDELIDFYAC
ncbi:auxin-responsive protein SAUR50-like [Phalaenopsis equestris]|uniref:auxin-responsive protein SAUR50-like n=1 Tax=Phalaenopsis equestris TaxID=78828 RepID=UPI0009E51709|nr:auxin-responsive protein SAUR50-like [Phalaenopsis equestris]